MVIYEWNALIVGPSKINILTLREVLFLKMLLINPKIIMYGEMRQFTKIFKKKLAPDILHNFQNIGYKLIL
mgnify:CR=1 FL=1